MPSLPKNSHGLINGVHWFGGLEDGRLVLVDQTRLPGALELHECRDLEDLRRQILALSVRGAPAIGIAGAFGLVLHLIGIAFRKHAGQLGTALAADCRHAADRLVSSRPTAVNLRWAIERMQACFERHAHHLTAQEMCARLLMEARRIQREDAELCARMAAFGAPLLPKRGGIYTHCNTGALATGGIGTALGCIVEAWRAGHRIEVFAGETRRLLQGGRLTAWELMQADVPVTLCTDSMAGHLMASGRITAVIVGADRIAANGDTANKIGTYGLAVLARHHRIPFYVAAPYSTFDLKLGTGKRIVIEERSPAEVRSPQGVPFAPDTVPVINPAFDVTPGALITAIVTERGVIRSPTRPRVMAVMKGKGKAGDG